MLSIRFWHVSGVISFHSSATLSHNSCTPFGGVEYSFNFCFKCTHKCSMGLRSGDWAGQTRTWILLSLNHCVALFEVCLGSLSYWKILSSSSISNSSKLSTSPSSKISQYCFASMIPWTSVSFPTPFHPIHPHTMRLFLPPCLTVGVVVLSESGSPLCFQVYTLPSDPILFIFVSSDHKTLFQSSTVQFLWYQANLRQACRWSFLRRGRFCLTTERKLFSLRAFLTVWGVTGEEMMLLIKWVLQQHYQAFQW